MARLVILGQNCVKEKTNIHMMLDNHSNVTPVFEHENECFADILVQDLAIYGGTDHQMIPYELEKCLPPGSCFLLDGFGPIASYQNLPHINILFRESGNISYFNFLGEKHEGPVLSLMWFEGKTILWKKRNEKNLFHRSLLEANSITDAQQDRFLTTLDLVLKLRTARQDFSSHDLIDLMKDWMCSSA